MNASKILRTLGALGLILVLSRCSNSTTSSISNAPSGSFTNIYQNTLSTDCLTCHPGSSATAAGVTLDFSTQAKAYSSLVGTTGSPSVVSATDYAPKCPNVQFVVSDQPSQSYLEAEVDPSYYVASDFAGVSTCTPYDHSGTISLSTSELASITAWINAGIPND